MAQQGNGRRKNSRKKIINLIYALAVFCLSGMLFLLQNPNVAEQAETQAETDQTADSELLEAAQDEDEDTGTLEVHFIDVGQGSATLIKCGEHAMLIDAGGNDKGTALQLYLKKQQVESLDYLVLTHADADHIGGADVLITKLDIDKVFMSDYAKDTKTYEDVIQALFSRSLAWETPKVSEVYELGEASFTILAPNEEYQDSNEASIALMLNFKENSFLFTGDAGEKSEEDMLANGLSLEADVYLAGHHGSRYSSCEAFLDAVSPSYVVISCGAKNTYGHPHAETLNNLRKRGIQVFRTDEQGSIVAVSNGKQITFNCAPSESWQAGE